MTSLAWTDRTKEAVIGSLLSTATTGGVVVLYDDLIGQWDEISSLGSHLASLPTLQDILSRARQSDPSWEQNARNAKRVLRARLVRHTRTGQLSRLAAERISRGWTQAELGARVGMEQANISRLESSGKLSVKTARRLAETLKRRLSGPAVSDKNPRAIDVIVCDDVRVENTGKLMLVGVYLGNIVCRELPTILPTLSFLTKWKSDDGSLPKGVFRLLDPTGTEVVAVGTEAIPAGDPKPMLLSINRFVPVRLKVPGRYRWVFTAYRGRSRTLTTLDVVLADARAKETQRLDAGA